MLMGELLPKKYHIILEIATGDYHSLNQIADCIGITKQGVYEYLKKMREEGLIEVIDGTYRTTVKGIELLFSYLNDLDDYLQKKKRGLAIIKLSPPLQAIPSGKETRYGSPSRTAMCTHIPAGAPPHQQRLQRMRRKGRMWPYET